MRDAAPSGVARSEEHTSELQSRLHLVCRLLLEKKKKNYAARGQVDAQFTARTIPPHHRERHHTSVHVDLDRSPSPPLRLSRALLAYSSTLTTDVITHDHWSSVTFSWLTDEGWLSYA